MNLFAVTLVGVKITIDIFRMYRALQCVGMFIVIEIIIIGGYLNVNVRALRYNYNVHKNSIIESYTMWSFEI